MIKVLVSGFMGSMGQKTVHMVNDAPDFKLVAAFNPGAEGINKADYGLADDVEVFTSLDDIKTDAEVWIDFTVPSAVFNNIKFAITNGIHPVVGTSGMKDEQLAELTKLAQDKQVGGMVAPNFGLSAVLLMKFAQEAAKYLPDVEVIEMHHADKLDAPSGTAISTAKMISKAREAEPESSLAETIKGARGADVDNVRVHAVRLPGYIAHEQVLFGGTGEALTIRQDSFDRESFMGGVKIAVPFAATAKELVVGLENIL
ncbi:4-hydroxy-tetrahydrodipicolinate reductase [Lentilactobacillus sp. Marseille-Q4993]|uniref:4-hydroxy-tetrahydrodipicolinate reductase n=1 Tax=Lentilactobacillus sp. Marseille-Q4993 TaxID=3039492 RepID=UPI0024BC48B3|nr:4-hydroxy-tetrahydrodipicolinate reductase [Lentilactobacillus sp. Marseille-Q4993]